MQIVRLFAVDLDAPQIAEITRLNRNTINRYLAAIRERSARYSEAESHVSGEVEADERYFWTTPCQGRQSTRSTRKTIVFGLFKRNGRVYTEIVPDCAKLTLQGIIRGRVALESVIHSDGWRGYEGLVIWDNRNISA